MSFAKPDNTGYSPVQELFKKHFGKKADDIIPLTSHGSDRVILRMRLSGNSVIGIINRNLSENRAFIDFANHFRNCGLNVPEIYGRSNDESSYLMEDLGDTTLLQKITDCRNDNRNADVTELYKKAIASLPGFQIHAGRSVNYSRCYQFGEFGEENIRFDIDYFNNSFLANFYKKEIKASVLEKEFEFLISKLLEVNRDFFLYRDFQSRNIMIKNGDMYFIDFQSGRKGALLYDIASLLYDAKANIPQYERESYFEYYLDVIKNYENIDIPKYRNYFWFFAVIRILQAMGAYGFLGIVKGKERFLESVPLALKNIIYIIDNKIEGKPFDYLRNIFSGINNEKT